jgi:hypothetical protein
MALQTWILPILIGVVAAVLLVAILFNDTYKQKFADLGALIQLQTSRPYYYSVPYVPINYDAPVPPNPAQGQISISDSPLWVDGSNVSYPVYNFYPKAELNGKPNVSPSSDPIITQAAIDSGLAFANPNNAYDSHKAYYWALSGGYPYPYPVMLLPSANMDKVHGVLDKI